jgi:hypothetical protein
MSRRQVNGYREEAPEAPVYDDAHRAFLHAFFSNSVFTMETLRPVVAAILSAQGQRLPLFPCPYPSSYTYTVRI